MSAFARRLALAAALAALPTFAAAQSDDAAEETPKVEENVADESETTPKKTDEALNEEQQKLAEQDEEWADKLRKRHHEGDIALGVCGGRMTALMWFYQSSVADGRADLKTAYDALAESRGVLKKEAERRAVDDGVGTSVSVMNEHSSELWDKLVEASEEPETFQEVHDGLYADVQECLTLFFSQRDRSEADDDTPEEVGKAEDDETTGEDADAKAE